MLYSHYTLTTVDLWRRRGNLICIRMHLRSGGLNHRGDHTKHYQAKQEETRQRERGSTKRTSSSSTWKPARPNHLSWATRN
ncbi:MAG: hypothetical protein C4576_32145 [Desulfobacteraceae bacterium]|nr:MAG: hypothetical protein C4576_32145 [Desulfobacteraceae bacterium]